MKCKLPLVLLIVCLSFTVFGQTPKTHALSAEASKAWLELEDAKHATVNECQKAYGGLQAQQNALAIGAEIPLADREHWLKGKDGLIVFTHQEAVKTP